MYDVRQMDNLEFEKCFQHFKDVDPSEIVWISKHQSVITYKKNNQLLIFSYSKLHKSFSAEFITGVDNIRFDHNQDKAGKYKEFLDNACKNGNSEKASDYLTKS